MASNQEVVLYVHQLNLKKNTSETIICRFYAAKREGFTIIGIDFTEPIVLCYPWDLQQYKMCYGMLGINTTFWLNKLPTVAKINNSPIKIVHEKLTLTKFHVLVSDKVLMNFIKKVKNLKATGTKEAKETIDRIVNYFDIVEGELASSIGEKKIYILLSEIVKDENLKNIDSAKVSEYYNDMKAKMELKREAERQKEEERKQEEQRRKDEEERKRIEEERLRQEEIRKKAEDDQRERLRQEEIRKKAEDDQRERLRQEEIRKKAEDDQRELLRQEEIREMAQDEEHRKKEAEVFAIRHLFKYKFNWVIIIFVVLFAIIEFKLQSTNSEGCYTS